MLIAANRTEGPNSVGTELERDRLEHRRRRIERVVEELRRRARERRERDGVVPEPLWHAIAGFEHELSAVRRRLRELQLADGR